MRAMSVTSLLSDLHGEAFRVLCGHTGRSHEGLTVAARYGKRLKIISGPTTKRMERIDVAFHVATHINNFKSSEYLNDRCR